MNFKICFAVLGLQFAVAVGSPRRCPAFTATFTGLVEQTVDDLNFLMDDPEQTFFKEVVGFRDSDIRHVKDDVLTFFNDTYGLDFSLSSPNEQGQYFLGNARLRLIRTPETRSADDFRLYLVSSNWIQTGSTRFACRDMYFGGFTVEFTEDMLLHGTYGGVDGKPVGVGNSVQYGYWSIDVCDQSPIIIQYSTPTPFRLEPIDGTGVFHLDLYNNVLGYGKAVETVTIRPDEDNPGKYRISNRAFFTFPAM